MMNEAQSIDKMAVKDVQSDQKEYKQVLKEADLNMCKEKLFSSLIALERSKGKGTEAKYEKYLKPDLKIYRIKTHSEYPESPLTLAGYALFCIFFIGRDCQFFTEDEKRAVAELISSAMEQIKENIMSTNNVFWYRLTSTLRLKRSALEYLKENYANFPVGDKTLLNKLEEAEIEKCETILEKLIDNRQGDSDPEDSEAKRVPDTHHRWWYTKSL